MLTTAGKVVIVGAGQVGSTFAFALQIHGVAREIVLIDADPDRARGNALDLSHGNFFTPPSSVTAGDYPDCRDADIVVITAGASQKPGQSRMELVGRNVEICRSIVESVMTQTRDAILVMVTNPVDVLTYAALHFSGLPRHRVIGSGTVLDSARFRYLLSEHCHVDPQNVHAYVLGEHGDSEVVAWSLTTLAGMRLEDYCSQCDQGCLDVDREAVAAQVRESAYHVIEAKGATNFAVALALAKITGSILRNGNSILTVSRLLVGEYGIENVCLSMPTVVDRQGAARPITPRLSDRELADLRASAEAIRHAQRSVGLPERLDVLV